MYGVLLWIHVVQAIIPLAVIFVTSTWTFVFTRGFLKKNLKRNKNFMDKENFTEHKHIYTIQIKNLVGIFGSLMIFTGLSWTPYFIVSIAGLKAGFDSIPPFVYMSAFIIFLITNISNPIIQIYFRKDLTDSLKNISRKCRISSIKCPTFTANWRRKSRISSNNLTPKDASNEQVQLEKRFRAFSAPVIKKDYDHSIPVKMADSYSCGHLTVAMDDLVEHQYFMNKNSPATLS